MTPSAPLTLDEAYALVRKALPAGKLDQFMATPDGRAMLAAVIAPCARLSLTLTRSITAQHRMARAGTVSAAAAGATAATATIRIVRRAATIGHGIILPARSVGCQLGTHEGHRYQLVESTCFGAGELGARLANVVAVVPGAASNVSAGQIDRFVAVPASEGDGAVLSVTAGTVTLTWGRGDRFASDMIGAYVEFLSGPNRGRYARVLSALGDEPFGSLTLAAEGLVSDGAVAWRRVAWEEFGLLVDQPEDCTPGCDDELDALGRELGRLRQTGEDDDAYRAALNAAPDVVTPLALVRALVRTLGEHVTVWESGTTRWDTAGREYVKPWPGLVLNGSPLGIDEIVGPAEDLPPAGLCHLSGRRRFVVAWQGREETPVGCVLSTDALGDDGSGLPRSAVLGLSALTRQELETGENARLRALATTEIERVRAHGVRWAWACRRWKA